MTAPLEFYFDFSSPYAYIGAMRIDELAARHGRSVDWRPMLLGVALKATGSQPLTGYPLKGQYSTRDFARSAREYGIPFKMPTRFPIPTQAAARAVLWLKQHDQAGAANRAVPFAKAAYTALFVYDTDISSPDAVLDVAEGLGIDRAALAAGIEDPAIKDALRAQTDEAVHQRGVFGAPFVFVDGEPFWGADRFEMIERWLKRGGW